MQIMLDIVTIRVNDYDYDNILMVELMQNSMTELCTGLIHDSRVLLGVNLL